MSTCEKWRPLALKGICECGDRFWKHSTQVKLAALPGFYAIKKEPDYGGIQDIGQAYCAGVQQGQIVAFAIARDIAANRFAFNIAAEIEQRRAVLADGNQAATKSSGVNRGSEAP